MSHAPPENSKRADSACLRRYFGFAHRRANLDDFLAVHVDPIVQIAKEEYVVELRVEIDLLPKPIVIRESDRMRSHTVRCGKAGSSGANLIALGPQCR